MRNPVEVEREPSRRGRSAWIVPAFRYPSDLLLIIKKRDTGLESEL